MIAGGGQFSTSYANHSRRIAAQMGFGLGNFRGPDFLSHKLVVPLHPIVGFGGWSHERKLTFKDIPWTIDGPYFLTFHDRDVSLDPGSLARLLDDLGSQVRYMSANEYTAYLHAGIRGDPSEPLAFLLEYDEHYCRYFATHPSSWTLHVADRLRQPGEPEKRLLELSPGLGRRSVRGRLPGESTHGR